MSMQITAVEIDEAKLWNGAKVRNLKNGQIREVMVIPADMTISQAAAKGLFNPAINIDLQTLLLNKTRFKLIEDDED